MTFLLILSQGKVATANRWSGQIYELLMSNILHTKNHFNRLILTELFKKEKGGQLFGT